MLEWRGNGLSIITWPTWGLRKVTSAVFIHRNRDLRVVTHVDDFLVAGEDHRLKWLKEELANKYGLKVQVARWQPGDDRELSFLGRIMRMSSAGIELEGDDKHVHGFIEEWNRQE